MGDAKTQKSVRSCLRYNRASKSTGIRYCFINEQQRYFVNVLVDIHMKKIIIPSCLRRALSVSYASHQGLTENML